MNLVTDKIEKIYYISPRDVRKNRADAVHIMYSCAAFSNNGIVVKLIAPKVQRTDYIPKNNNIFDLYDVPENFKIRELSTKIREVNNRSSRILVLLNKFSFIFIYLLTNLSSFRNKKVVVYSKCYISIIPYILLRFMGLINCKLVFETPFLRDDIYHKFIMKQMNAVVVMTSYVEDFLISNFNIQKSKVIKCPIRFQTDYQENITVDKLKIRNYLKWDKNYRYVVYAGKAGKNSNHVKIFAEASKKFKNTKFVIVGATKKLNINEREYENLMLYPFQPYREYLKFVQAADILVATYKDSFYNRYTLSPGKAGAYLQSKNPVIFTDFPCLRSRFNENIVSFVTPNDINALNDKISEIFSRFDFYKEKALRADKLVSDKTFTNASVHILKRLNHILFNS